MRFLRLSSLTVLGGVLAAAEAFAQVTPRPSIVIERVETPPKLEDYVSGEKEAGPSTAVRPGTRITGFLQREPNDLAPSSEETVAYLSYDDAHIYAVFVCRAKDPSRIRARMARRESVFQDDAVGVILDTFNDKQRAYMFFSTPLGVQADGITTEGQQDDMSFDTVWQSRGMRTDFGYVASIAIPFKSLRFPAGTGPQTWGIALMRSIPSSDEISFWPGITRRISGFAIQLGQATGIDGVSPGRNIQLIPYGTFSAARFLDRTAARFDDDREGRVGVDAKVVARDAMTFDFTVNPDFSQVESDEPQVTVNQRFEVFFPERRPFFIENAGYFQTPVTLFFSRRMRDPQFGSRATGKIGRWAVGALVADDRAPGQALDPTDPFFSDRTYNVVGRARREFANQSSIGALVTSRDFGPSSNRVGSIDARIRLNPRWFFTGQAAVSDTETLAGEHQRDTAFSASLGRDTRTLAYSLVYQDIGPDFRTQLGFVPRTDIRKVNQFVAYRWRPSKGPVLAFGPNSFLDVTWNHGGELQDWDARFPFEVAFRRQSSVSVRRSESMTRFGGTRFRHHENFVVVNSSALSWMDASAAYSQGTRPNFFPAAGVSPFLAEYRDIQAGLTLRPMSSLLIGQSYLLSHLAAGAGSSHQSRVFDNHILRTRVNYQFTREFSARAILDYNGIWANQSLVALHQDRRFTADLLFTYLLNPGTAVYVGYTDGYENVAIDDLAGLRTIRRPTTSTGRQLFVKTSYLLRF
ncbi:MAG: DUF5916 domain-containing protein [Vicinamibacterales bacterium]